MCVSIEALDSERPVVYTTDKFWYHCGSGKRLEVPQQWQYLFKLGISILYILFCKVKINILQGDLTNVWGKTKTLAVRYRRLSVVYNLFHRISAIFPFSQLHKLMLDAGMSMFIILRKWFFYRMKVFQNCVGLMLKTNSLVPAGNKIDLKEQRQVPEEDGRKLAAEESCDYFETSARENIGVGGVHLYQVGAIGIRSSTVQ